MISRNQDPGYLPFEHRRDEYVYIEGYGFTPHLPGRNMIRIYGNAVGYALIVFLLLQDAAPRLVVWMLRLLRYPAIRIYNNRFLASAEVIELIYALSSLICYLLPTLMLLVVLRIPRRIAFPLHPVGGKILFPAVGIVLASSAVGSSLSLMLSSLLEVIHLSPSGPDIPVPDSASMLLLTLLSSVIFPAFFEELLFRGLLMQSLRRFGEPFALVATTLLFGMLHGNLVQLPNALLTGLVLGYLVLRTGSLVVGIVCHLINNLLPVLLQAATSFLPDQTANLLFLIMTFLYILLGIAGTIFLLFTRPTLFAPLHSEGRRIERYKYRSFFFSIPILAVLLFLSGRILLNMLIG